VVNREFFFILKLKMKRCWPRFGASGFTTVELLIATVVFPIIVIGISGVFDSVAQAYKTSRQLNEIYAVLSACPEIDRALDYDSVTSATNCFPNNSFKTEGNAGFTISYTPNLTVNTTNTLPTSDPLYTVPDSKVLNINVGFPDKPSAPTLKLRLLITRNGIGQL
jgi:hypothetical protein